MIDIARNCTNNLKALLDEEILSRESFSYLLNYILDEYRFPVNFCYKLSKEIYACLDKDLDNITPRPGRPVEA